MLKHSEQLRKHCGESRLGASAGAIAPLGRLLGAAKAIAGLSLYKRKREGDGSGSDLQHFLSEL